MFSSPKNKFRRSIELLLARPGRARKVRIRCTFAHLHRESVALAHHDAVSTARLIGCGSIGSHRGFLLGDSAPGNANSSGLLLQCGDNDSGQREMPTEVGTKGRTGKGTGGIADQTRDQNQPRRSGIS